MPLSIELPETAERILTERAAKAGKTLEAYATILLQRESKAKTLDEILAPFRHSFEESGMTEEELDAFVEEIREEIYQEELGLKK